MTRIFWDEIYIFFKIYCAIFRTDFHLYSRIMAKAWQRETCICRFLFQISKSFWCYIIEFQNPWNPDMLLFFSLVCLDKKIPRFKCTATFFFTVSVPKIKWLMPYRAVSLCTTHCIPEKLFSLFCTVDYASITISTPVPGQ